MDIGDFYRCKKIRQNFSDTLIKALEKTFWSETFGVAFVVVVFFTKAVPLKAYPVTNYPAVGDVGKIKWSR